MDHPPQLVLDYAAPKSHGKIRLPSQCTLRVRDVEPPEGGVEIVEKMEAKLGAVVAMLFAMFTLFALWAPSAHELYRMVTYHHRLDSIIVLPVLLSLAQCALVPAVINNTWRKTTMRVRGGEIALRLTSPFSGAFYVLPSAEIIDIMVTRDVASENTRQATLGEVIIRYSRGEARLFHGHPFADLEELRALILQTLNPLPTIPVAINPDPR